MITPKTRKMILQILIFVAAFFLSSLKQPIAGYFEAINLGQLARNIGYGLDLLVWTALAWLATGLIAVIFWDNWAKRLGHTVPKLLQQITNVTIYVVVLITAVSVIFKASIPGLIAGSSVIAAIVGLAVTRMISDVFSGFALSIEKSYSVGDWLEIEMKTRPLGFIVGQVVELNWRATRLVTKANETLIIPNSEMAKMKFVNFSIPEKYYRTDIQVYLSHTIPPERVKRIFSAAIKLTPGILKKPEFKITLMRFTDKGVLWCARIYINDYANHRKVVKATHESILRHLQVAGINLSYNRVELHTIESDIAEISKRPIKKNLVKRIDIFDALNEDQHAILSTTAREHFYTAKENIFSQGDAGYSLFIVAEGFVSVSITDTSGVSHAVANIEPGQYFGEMSLLTGEPRMATVSAETDVICYEITKECLLPIFQAEPALLEKVTRLVARRQKMAFVMAETAIDKGNEEDKEMIKKTLLQKVQHFFGIKSA